MTDPLSFDHLQAILRQHTAGLPDFRKPSPNTPHSLYFFRVLIILSICIIVTYKITCHFDD
jgi:hypothetical protein